MAVRLPVCILPSLPGVDLPDRTNFWPDVANTYLSNIDKIKSENPYCFVYIGKAGTVLCARMLSPENGARKRRKI